VLFLVFGIIVVAATVGLIGRWAWGRSVTDRSRQGSAKKSARLIKGAKEIDYPGAPHGLTSTHQDQVNAGLPAFRKT
jgi:hypothetical protein